MTNNKTSQREEPLDLVGAYTRLLALFPEDAQGHGLDRGGPPGVAADQPMTYGLVLSAESLRYRATPSGEGNRRIRQAALWLLDNSNLGGNNIGWGLPHAWEHRPTNTVFTITTAIAIEGLLDALKLPLWSPAELDRALVLMRQVCNRWSRELWADGYSGGYFGYSPRDMAPPFFCINAPAMYLGALSRLMAEHKGNIPRDELHLVQEHADALARACLATVELRSGSPYWEYIAQPNPLNSKRPNDLIHHVYILWGLETYRETGGHVKFPWTLEGTLESLDRFWKGGTIRFMAQDETTVTAARREEPANAWGTGMLLACYGRWRQSRKTRECFEAILASYGPFPRIRVLPAHVSDDAQFYPRDAAHVLFGLAYSAFGT